MSARRHSKRNVRSAKSRSVARKRNVTKNPRTRTRTRIRTTTARKSISRSRNLTPT